MEGQGGDLCRDNESEPYGGSMKVRETGLAYTTTVKVDSNTGLAIVLVAAVAVFYFYA